MARHHLVAARALRAAAVVPADRVRQRRRARRPRSSLALVWANLDASSYESFWHTELSIRLGSTRSVVRPAGVGQQRADDVVLPGRRAWRRGASSTSATCASGGASCCRSPSGWSAWPCRRLIFLAFNAGRDERPRLGHRDVDRHRARPRAARAARPPGARPGAGLPGDGVRGGRPGRAGGDRGRLQRRHRRCCRCWSRSSSSRGLLVAVRLRMQQRWLFVLLGVVIWSALMASGVDPLVAGLAIGLAAPAYTPSRGELEEATGRVRQFREEPTPELARSATAGLTQTLSPNARLQTLLPPVDELRDRPAVRAVQRRHRARRATSSRSAYTAPVTLGVLVGYVVGKPVAVVVTSWAVTRLSARPGPSTGRLGRRDRQRHHLRDRLHRRPADRHPRARRRRSSPRPRSARSRRSSSRRC